MSKPTVSLICTISLLAAGCVSTRSQADELRRAGSLSHSFGAVLVVSGISNAVVSGGLGAAVATDDDDSLPVLLPILVGVSAVVQLILGGGLIARGNGLFDDARYLDIAPKQQQARPEPTRPPGELMQRMKGEIQYEAVPPIETTVTTTTGP